MTMKVANNVRNAWLKAARRSTRGATVAEYALVLALVSLAMIAVLDTLGATLEEKIFEIVSKLRGLS